MTAIFASLLLLAEPASTAIDQLGTTEARDTSAPIEQVTRGGNTPFIDNGPVPDAQSDVPQLSVSDNEVLLARVEGIDRCSAELLSADDKAYCSRRIETRSAEFGAGPAATLSLEQKLLGERVLPLRGLANAARAINASPQDGDVQALASITLAPPPSATPQTPDRAAPGNLSTETQALVDAIVSKLANPGN